MKNINPNEILYQHILDNSVDYKLLYAEVIAMGKVAAINYKQQREIQIPLNMFNKIFVYFLHECGPVFSGMAISSQGIHIVLTGDDPKEIEPYLATFMGKVPDAIKKIKKHFKAENLPIFVDQPFAKADTNDNNEVLHVQIILAWDAKCFELEGKGFGIKEQ